MKQKPLLDQRITTLGKLVEVHARLDRVLGKSLESSHGISHSCFEALVRIGRSERGQLMMSELASQIALTTGGLTRLVDRLVESGHVCRVPDPKDRRVQYVELTTAGASKLDEAVRTHLDDLNEHLFDRLTKAEADQLDQLLEKLR